MQRLSTAHGIELDEGRAAMPVLLRCFTHAQGRAFEARRAGIPGQTRVAPAPSGCRSTTDGPTRDCGFRGLIEIRQNPSTCG